MTRTSLAQGVRTFTTSRVAIFIAAIIVCVAIAKAVEHALVAAIAITSALVIGLVWPFMATRLLTGTATAPVGRCRAGDTIEIDVVVRNAFLLPIPAMSVAVDACSNLELATNQTSYRRGRNSATFKAVAAMRGVMPLSRLALETSFSFGLWRAKRHLTSNDQFIVWPRGIPVDSALLRGNGFAIPMDRLSSQSPEGELAGVRAYRRGDSVRTIHWQQTARHDRLIVRERAGGERRGIIVQLDTRRSSYPAPDQFERAVSLVAGVLEQAREEFMPVIFLIEHRRHEVVDAAGFSAAMDALAAAELSDGDHSLPRSTTGSIVVTTSLGWATAADQRSTPLIVDDNHVGGTRC